MTNILLFLVSVLMFAIVLLLAPTLSYAVLPMDDPVKRHACIKAGLLIAVGNLFGKTGEELIDTAGNVTETCLVGGAK